MGFFEGFEKQAKIPLLLKSKWVLPASGAVVGGAVGATSDKKHRSRNALIGAILGGASGIAIRSAYRKNKAHWQKIIRATRIPKELRRNLK
jgi:hypothetical protein